MYANPKPSALASGLLHAAAIFLVLAVITVNTPPRRALGFVLLAERDIPPMCRPAVGRGGGVARDEIPATRAVRKSG
jgi:hypothetical protein